MHEEVKRECANGDNDDNDNDHWWILIIDDRDDHDHVQVHEEVKQECANGSLTAANIQEAAPRLLVEKPYHIFHNVN